MKTTVDEFVAEALHCFFQSISNSKEVLITSDTLVADHHLKVSEEWLKRGNKIKQMLYFNGEVFFSLN